MPRPAVATPADIRQAVLALVAEAGVGAQPSAQAFRRAVSVRKVRERIGGGNPATIGQVINAVETELVRAGADRIVLPELPADVAELMQQVWRAAVGAQLDAISQLRSQAQAVADGAQEALKEAQLRAEVLKQELAELRAAVADRDARLAQASTDQAALLARTSALEMELESDRVQREKVGGEADAVRAAQAQAVTAAQERYEGLSRRLLEETGQQRQAAQAELGRLASQLKFADKRQATLEGRLQQLEDELVDVRGQHQKATGEVAALRYVNTSLRSQLDGFVSALARANAVRSAGPASARASKRAPRPVKADKPGPP
jgi:DNA repair exonuclease SbcCD ATPase subunit